MRLVTRSDFDGLVCAVLLKQVEDIHAIQFVHPKDLQDGKFEVTPNDILTNVPYIPGCGMWFDHHATEVNRVVGKYEYTGDCWVAPSAARVVYEYYGGAARFQGIEEMMREVDKADSAQFTREDILHPQGWPLLSFVMDARTGLGRFKDYRISNYQLMYDLIEACSHLSIQEILQLPDVAERVERYFEQDALFREMLLKHTHTEWNVIVTDLRGV
ncbi:MAG TPA: exopolyphosphatase, partial [Chthonomonadaceae bacterium]|nr:exopolyphosphatase [Chthonomonadaceae bacterium]